MRRCFLIAITICAVVFSVFAIRVKTRRDARAAVQGAFPQTRDYSADYVERDFKNPRRDSIGKMYLHVTPAAGGFYFRKDSTRAEEAGLV